MAPNELAAARRRPAGIALATSAAPDQRQLAALTAGIAFISFQTRQADLLFRGAVRFQSVHRSLHAIAVFGKWVQVSRPRCGAGRRHRRRLNHALRDNLLGFELGLGCLVV